MKKKITCPDWNSPVDMLISRSNPHDLQSTPVWSEYTPSEDDTLDLRVTVEVAGGPCLLWTLEKEEERERVRLEENRRAAWCNAIQFTEQLWKTRSSDEYVVRFRPCTPATGREVVCVCRKGRTLTAILRDKRRTP